MDHRPYPKIATRLAPGTAAPGGPWVATEKIHGAQLVLATDGAEVRIGKRKAWLDPDEPFFGWQLKRGELTVAALAMHRRLGGRSVVRLFGELFGSGFSHPEVAPVPGASLVQTGIWYAPGIHFALFDVLVEEPSGPVFLGHSELERAAKEVELLTPPVLGRGPRGDLDRLPVRFLSRVPALLGLPAVRDNWAEGYVLKPDQRAAPEQRPIVKRKIPEFEEQRFDESAPWNPDAPLDVSALCAHGERLVNPPRLASARSKLGDAPGDQLVEEIVLDVLIDLEAAFPRAMRQLGAEDEKALRRHLTERART